MNLQRAVAHLLLVAGALFVLLPDTLAGYRLRRDGVQAMATLVSYEPDNHHRVRYSFTDASGTSHSGADNGCRMLGGLVPIAYSQSRPEISRCGGVARKWWTGPLIGAMFIAVGAVFIEAAFAARRKRRSP